MGAPSKTNLPAQPLRWTLNRASREFAVSTETLAARLNQAGVKVSSDGCYSSHEISIGLLGGDIAAERLRWITEQADHVALKNAEKRKEMVPADEVHRALEPLFLAIRQEILASPLDPEQQDSILKHLSDFDYLAHKYGDGQKPNGAKHAPAAGSVRGSKKR